MLMVHLEATSRAYYVRINWVMGSSILNGSYF